MESPSAWGRRSAESPPAAAEAARQAEVTQSIGCLVSEDGQSSTRFGSFQNSEDVFGLLCALSHSLETIGAMAEVGSYAASQLIPIPQPKVKP